MQTHSTTHDEQEDAADRNDAEVMPRALSDQELDSVVGGLSLNFVKIEY